jgi:cytochrome c biogenesis protein CcmG, thiol:disulfide interchange protein DsbE
MALKPSSTLTLLLSVSALVYAVLLLMPGGMGSGKLVGQPAPELHLEMPGVGRVALSEFKGQVVLLNFWADWCVPCLEEMPSLKLLEQKMDPKRFVLIALNVDGEKARGTVEALAKQLPKLTAIGVQEKELEVYGVQALPYSLLIDSQGVVRKAFLGSRDWVKPGLVQEIEQYLPPAG